MSVINLLNRLNRYSFLLFEIISRNSLLQLNNVSKRISLLSFENSFLSMLLASQYSKNKDLYVFGILKSLVSSLSLKSKLLENNESNSL